MQIRGKTKMCKIKSKKTLEWTCGNCNKFHIERVSNVSNNITNVKCRNCGSERTIFLIEQLESSFAADWLELKCQQCTERRECLSDKNTFEKRIKLINKLGFCEDYIVDSSELSKNPYQVCYEERTFDEIYNKGGFQLDERDNDEN